MVDLVGLAEDSVHIRVPGNDAAIYIYVGGAFDHDGSPSGSETGVHILNHRIVYRYFSSTNPS